MTQTDSQRDVVDLLSADHREFDRIFTELEGLIGQTDPDVLRRKRELVDEVTIGLVKHSVAEETRVYPKVEQQVDREEAENSKHEHAEAEETMKRLEQLDPTDPTFDTEIRKLMSDIRTHVAEEEGEMFPHMREILSQEELVSLGKKVDAIKKMAPTRPHPSVPNEPGPRLAAGPVAGLFDRLRDLASGRGKEG